MYYVVLKSGAGKNSRQLIGDSEGLVGTRLVGLPFVYE